MTARGDTLLVGATRDVYASFDGGTTWNAAGTPHPDAQGLDALVLTDHGWYAGAHGHGVYRSTDRGQTWQSWNTGLVGLGTPHVNALYARAGWLYAATEGGVFRRAEDGGGWQRYGTIFSEYEAETVNAMALHQGRLVAAGGGNGYIFVEQAETGTWTPVSLNTYVLEFATNGALLVAVSRLRCYFSIDDGITWLPCGPGLPSGQSASVAILENTAYVLRTTGTGVSNLYRSSDLTGAWTHVVMLGDAYRLFAHGGKLFLAQADGLYVLAGTPVHQHPDDRPTTPLRLDMPSPHPVRATSHIVFTLPHASPARLTLYDALGRRVAVLHDGMTPAGQTNINWSASELPAGVYALHLDAAGDRVTQPLVVLH